MIWIIYVNYNTLFNFILHLNSNNTNNNNRLDGDDYYFL